MKTERIRDTPEVVVPKGHEIEDMVDVSYEDEYELGEPVETREVKIRFE